VLVWPQDHSNPSPAGHIYCWISVSRALTGSKLGYLSSLASNKSCLPLI